MLASARSARTNITRRAAFTLVEVLVVVAIVVILASVGTLATLKFLADAKVDNARLTANTIEQAAKTYEIRNPETDITQAGIQELIPYLDRGVAGLKDPWGQQYQISSVPRDDGSNGRRIFVYTVSPEDNKTYGWPRELEPVGQ